MERGVNQLRKKREKKQKRTRLRAWAVQREGGVDVVVLGDEQRRHVPARVALGKCFFVFVCVVCVWGGRMGDEL